MLKESGFSLSDIIINNEYTAKGEFLINKGEYSIYVSKEEQQIHCYLIHSNYSFKINLMLNHVKLSGYDFVTVARIELEPDISFWRDEQLVMNGTIDTDYMIFNYAPLNDFQGSFTISPHTISDIDLTWGEVYRASGEIVIDEPRSLNGELSITDLDLGACESIIGYVMPKEIDGIINSRVLILGEVENPTIEGHVRSGPGRFKALSFKKVIINAFGNRNKLTFQDSKIFRSDNVFYLVGTLDFTKKNIFHDVVLESGEKIILWRGWDLSKSIGGDTFSLKRKVTDTINLNVEGAFRSDDFEDSSSGEGAVSLEYKYEDDQSISLSFEEEESDEAVTLKHTLTF